jgi:hypothetical protein
MTIKLEKLLEINEKARSHQEHQNMIEVYAAAEVMNYVFNGINAVHNIFNVKPGNPKLVFRPEHISSMKNNDITKEIHSDFLWGKINYDHSSGFYFALLNDPNSVLKSGKFDERQYCSFLGFGILTCVKALESIPSDVHEFIEKYDTIKDSQADKMYSVGRTNLNLAVELADKYEGIFSDLYLPKLTKNFEISVNSSLKVLDAYQNKEFR